MKSEVVYDSASEPLTDLSAYMASPAGAPKGQRPGVLNSHLDQSWALVYFIRSGVDST